MAGACVIYLFGTLCIIALGGIAAGAYLAGESLKDNILMIESGFETIPFWVGIGLMGLMGVYALFMLLLMITKNKCIACCNGFFLFFVFIIFLAVGAVVILAK